MKTILASAYAVNPYKGSEDGMGWNFIYQIARYQKVIAITRENNKPYIQKYMSENPDELYDNITFLYFDLPYWARFWKKGSRGAMLYFYLWQRNIPSFVKKQNLQFDIAHNVNFHNDWTPSFLWKLGKPFVWGPIGHHPVIPSEYLASYKKTYIINDKIKSGIKWLFMKFSDNLKKTKENSAHIFCMNKSVAGALNLKPNTFSITPSVATQDFGFDLINNTKKFTLITAGRLVPLKGFDLTIKSFAEFIKNQPLRANQCELIIVGDGPELDHFIQLTQVLGIEQQVRFIKWMSRDKLMQLFKTSSAFIFPSHEGAGMVVAEALSFGLPVICLDNCGPGEFINSTCGIKVSYSGYQQTIKELTIAITDLFNAPELLKRMRVSARKHFEDFFHWDVRGNELKKVYNNI